jgi:alpha-tubulin suppressor-like RCC1 family protein
LSTTVGIKTNGSIYTWGSNAGNLLMDPSNNAGVSKSTPILVNTDYIGTSWVSASIYNHLTFISSSGQLATNQTDATVVFSNADINISPVQIGSEYTWVSSSSGDGRLHAIRSDGTLWFTGRVLTSTTNNQTSVGDLTQIDSDSDWKDVSSFSSNVYEFVGGIGLKTNGTIWSWGRNSEGQLGDGTTTYRSSPVQIGSGTDWDKVHACKDFAFAIKSNGTLWSWGENSLSQLGTSNLIDRSSPVQVGLLDTWKYITGNSTYSAGITNEDVIKTTGDNTYTAALGYDYSNTIALRVSSLKNIKDTSNGEFETFYIDETGKIWGWGNNATGIISSSNLPYQSPVQVTNASDWSKISANHSHVMAIKDNGTLWGWGLNTSGQLGDRTITSKTSPVQVGSGTDWYKVFTGNAVTFGIKNNGTLWAWGLGTSGQLGDNVVVSRSSPVQIGSDMNWSDIFPGQSATTTFGIKTDGTLWVWGVNSSYQYGNEDSVVSRSSPTQIGSDVDWKSFMTNGTAHHALKTNGDLWTWGTYSEGNLGTEINRTTAGFVKIPKPFQSTFISVANYIYQTFMIDNTGTLWGFGDNTSYALGIGNTTAYYEPIRITTTPEWQWVSNGQDFAMAIKTNGTLWGWGLNTSGQLGQNVTTTRSLPTQTGTDTNWLSVDSGTTFSNAIKSNGTLWGWGLNTSGQLGDNTIVTKSSPVQIGTDTDWAKNYAGLTHAFAIKSNGTLWGWGNNNVGRLGTNSTTNYSSPIQIQSTRSWSMVALGNSHTMGISLDGKLWGWGLNTNGQLGDNTVATKSSPVQIGTATDWAVVGCGTSHTMAIKSNGTLWGWGSNTSYELGSGTNVNRSSPVQIGSATDWLYVFGSSNVTFAVKTDGTIYSVGTGFAGSGIGTGYYGMQSRSSPVQIGGGYRDIFPNVRYNARRAIKSDGTLWAWGTNTTLQAGISPATNLTSPVQIGIDTDWYTSLSNNQTNLDIKKTIVT